MGAATSVYDKHGRLQPYHYPYSLTQKMWQFPWKFYFTNSKFTRLLFYGCLLTAFEMHRLTPIVDTPKTREFWANVKEEYKVNRFSPPRPPNYDRPPRDL